MLSSGGSSIRVHNEGDDSSVWSRDEPNLEVFQGSEVQAEMGIEEEQR